MLDRSPRSGSDRPLGPNLLVRSESDPYVRLVAAPTSPGAGPAGPAADGRCKSEESTASSTATEVLSHGRAWLVQRSQSLNVGQPITLHTEPFSLFSLAQPIDTDKDGRGVAHSYNANTAKCLSAILRPVGTGGIPLRRHSSNASNCPGAASAADTCHSSPASPRSPRFGGPPSPSPSTEFRLDLEMGWSLPRSESLGSANDPAADEDIGSELAALNAQLGDMALAPERRDELTMQAAALRLQLEEIMLTPRIGRARFGPDVVYTSTSRLVTRRSSENLGMDREHLVHEVLQANQTKLEELVARVGSPPRQPAEPAAALTSGPQAQGLSSVSQYQFGQHGIVPQYYQHPPDMPIWGAASTAWAEPLPGPTGLLTAEDAHRLTQPVVPEFPVAAQSAGVRQEAEHTPERYSKLKRIGGGAFSNIWMGFDRKNCVNVAVKVIDKVAQFPSAADSEFAISQSLDHHHVLKCLGRYQVNCQEHLIFQLCNEGDLFDRLESSEYDQDEEQCKLYIQQAADGLEYMHNRNLVHFDVKLENMLLHNNIIKICDFGLSGCHRSIRVGKPHGTCAYMPPELIRITRPTAQYAVLKSADVWAFAIVMYAVIFADLPWDKALPDSDPDYADFVDSCDQYLISKMQPWSLLATNLQSTMFRMLARDPRDRASMTEVAAEVRGRWLIDMDDDMALPEVSDPPLNDAIVAQP